MPHDSEQGEVSQEKLFRRLMETEEKDLPPIPDVAPSILRPVGTPEAPPSVSPPVSPPETTTGAAVASSEEEPKADMARLVDLTEQVLAQLMSLQDTVEEALGGG